MAGQGRGVSITNQDSKVSTSVLYEGAADALAARELVHTRATLLLQKQHDTKTNDSLQQLLCLEGDVRGQMALLGAGTRHRELHSEAACNGSANPIEDDTASPPIPEETSGLHIHTRLPQSPPQRLIAHSQLHCGGSSSQISTGTSQQTNAPVPLNSNTDSELQPAFGEQQWLNLARQVSLLQEVVLYNQQQQQKLERKWRSDRRHSGSRESMQRAVLMGVNAADSSTAHPRPLDKATGRTPSPPMAARQCTISRGETKSDTTLNRCTQIKDSPQAGRRSAAEERLMRHQQKIQQQKKQKDKVADEAIRQQLIKKGFNNGLFETNNFKPLPDAQLHDCIRNVNAANSQCNNGSSNSSCGADSVHTVLCCSEAPLAPATQPPRQGLNGTDTGEALTALSAKTSQVTRRLQPMAKVAISARPAGAERVRAPSGQLRPYPPTGTPRLFPPSLAAAAAATNQTISKAESSDGKSNTAGAKQLLTETTSNNTTQVQQSSTKGSNPGPTRQLANVGALPPPEEVADLLLGIK